MRQTGFSSTTTAVLLAAVVIVLPADRAAAQEVALTPLQANEVARGYRAEALELKTVVNDTNDVIGRIEDFIFGKDGNIYAVIGVGSFTGLSGQLIAVPFRNLKIDESANRILLPGASREALERLPVLLDGR